MNNEMKRLNTKGFTLVELLVAASIAILCITSVTAMLIKGREIDVGDRYRRYARACVITEFEQPQFHFSQYVNLLNQAGTTTQSITIDTRGAYDNISGVLTTTIGSQTTASSSTGINVPYIPVVITITWSTSDGNDTLSLTKYLTQVQPKQINKENYYEDLK